MSFPIATDLEGNLPLVERILLPIKTDLSLPSEALYPMSLPIAIPFLYVLASIEFS